jgi:penicillin-binding protein 2
VKKVVDRDGRTIKEFPPEVLRKTRFSAEQFRLVKEGLWAVVNEPRGTGAAARLYEVKVAGKTGTSQVVKMRDSTGDIPYQYRDHALFVAFAPYDKPEVAVAVVIEHGEHGGAAAAPVAGSILRHYFESKGVIKKPVRAETGNGDEEGDDQSSDVKQGERQ